LFDFSLRPLAAQYPKKSAEAQQIDASNHSWPGKYLRLGDAGTRPLTKASPMTTISSASTALDKGREEKSATDLELDIRCPET
jgi:hypothetical protein